MSEQNPQFRLPSLSPFFRHCWDLNHMKEAHPDARPTPSSRNGSEYPSNHTVTPPSHHRHINMPVICHRQSHLPHRRAPRTYAHTERIIPSDRMPKSASFSFLSSASSSFLRVAFLSSLFFFFFSLLFLFSSFFQVCSRRAAAALRQNQSRRRR